MNERYEAEKIFLFEKETIEIKIIFKYEVVWFTNYRTDSKKKEDHIKLNETSALHILHLYAQFY